MNQKNTDCYENGRLNRDTESRINIAIMGLLAVFAVAMFCLQNQEPEPHTMSPVTQILIHGRICDDQGCITVKPGG